MNLRDYWQFKKNRVHASLHDVSADDSDYNNVNYMTESKAMVIDFDRVKREYMNTIHISEDNAKSVDALFQVESKSGVEPDIYMVEFKNGSIDSRDIERKARDSVLIFQSITKTQLEDTRANVRFVLVYNVEKHPMSFKDARALASANLGKVDFCRFGLAHLRGFCFNNVMAYNQEEFEKKIVPHIKEL